MRRRIIKILVQLLKYFSNGTVGVYYATGEAIMKRNKAFGRFVVITDIFEKYYNVRIASLFQRNRRRSIVEKRQIFHSLAYKYTGLSTPQIGGMTKRSHATVLHSIKHINDLIETDKNIAFQYQELNEKIKAKLD